MTKMRRLARRLIAALVWVAAAQALPALAQEYPARPLQMMMPFPPGGIVDIMGRGFAQALGARLGQQVVVVNRPGAGLTIGMAAVAQAPADGYTIIYTPVTPVTIQPHRMKSLSYTRESFIPLCQVYESLFFVAVGPKSPFQDLKSLLDHARANPGKLRYATPGVGSSPHLAGAELWQKAGVQLTDVAYAGEVQSIPNLVSGDIDLGIITTTGVNMGKLRPLAVFADARYAAYPNVPTVTEAGLPVLPSGYGGLFVRADTPAPVVARLEGACREAAADPSYRELAQKQFQLSNFVDRAGFTARIDADFRAKAALLPTLKLPE
ncbi:MAG: tripartite tricarboxylate transporter substrate binding protein [Burkholderiales bacterium]|nr:tripartite tricarboxylate transporter substrate binding protein [Burkholderiales bacterium]